MIPAYRIEVNVGILGKLGARGKWAARGAEVESTARGTNVWTSRTQCRGASFGHIDRGVSDRSMQAILLPRKRSL